MKGIMRKLAKTLEFEVRNKLCSMCQHLVTIAPINEKPVQVCTKLNLQSPLTIINKKSFFIFLLQSTHIYNNIHADSVKLFISFTPYLVR
jgi:hypothetical protein